VIGLLVALAVVLAIAYQTQKVRETWGFLKESRTEVRKVVWPTRRETMQTTAIVIVIVSILAVALWLLDAVLTNAVQALLNVES
jgi:preprotein translocase subunit SecE